MQEADLGPLFRASSNASLGDFLRDEGIARALEAAGDDWKQQAIQAILHEFAGRIVMFEECSSFCMGLGIAPPGSNAWGALCRSMALSGLLEPIGEGHYRSSSPRNHSHKYRRWRVKDLQNHDLQVD